MSVANYAADGPAMKKHVYYFVIFLGGPMDPIHPVWGHVLVSWICYAMRQNVFEGLESTATLAKKNVHILSIFLGGPMGAIHPVWGHVLVSQSDPSPNSPRDQIHHEEPKLQL